jgi:hypothetical protein
MGKNRQPLMSFNTHNLIVEGINCANASASINYLHVYDIEIVAEQKLVWRVAFLLAFSLCWGQMNFRPFGKLFHRSNRETFRRK